MSDERAQARADSLKNAFIRITEKREKKVITKLVNAYRDNKLTQEMAYAAIMTIAELRHAGKDIGTEDLQ